jgi:predicted metal-dependent hydrolase
MIAFIVLILVNLIILAQTKQPQALVEVKEKYRILREHLIETNNEKFRNLKRCVPITAFHRMRDTIGYNTNKGQEIAICLDGEPNEIFHVLIHELAHSTVQEYSHSEKFWDNYIELRDMCVNLGIYEKIPERTKFCGQHIQDK